MQRTVEHKGREYTVTFDEYDALDTVQNAKTGKYLKSTNQVVQEVLKNRVPIIHGRRKLD